MHQLTTSLLLLLLPAVALAEADRASLLLRHPTLNRSHVVFVIGGDLWMVSRNGGDAQRLTSTGQARDPIFSPDGAQIAFTGEQDGNYDVYVLPAAGGVPRRLTYHSGPDFAAGWTSDSKNILFASQRNSHARFNRLFTIPAQGGFPTEVPLPMAEFGSFSPDGSRLAYVPYSNETFILDPQYHMAWKRYRGGTTSPIWIADLRDSRITKISRNNSNDFNPMWVGNKIYFLSDRKEPVTLFVYDPATKEVSQLVENRGLDIKSASAGPGAIVYEQLGALNLFDLDSGRTQALDVRVAGANDRRPGGLRLASRHSRGRPDRVQPLLLCSGGQGGGGD